MNVNRVTHDLFSWYFKFSFALIFRFVDSATRNSLRFSINCLALFHRNVAVESRSILTTQRGVYTHVKKRRHRINNRSVKRIFRNGTGIHCGMPRRGGGGWNRSPREIERARPINFYLMVGAEETRSEGSIENEAG